MDGDDRVFDDRTPGVEHEESTANFLSYTAGLGLAILATIASFVVSQTNLLWAPGIPVGLVVLAFAQIGVHLVFFLHLGSGPDNKNNILALAFGLLIVFLVITGSVWIIANLNANMMPMPGTMPRWQVLASHFTHYALYACIVIQPVTGFVGSLCSPYPIKYFGYTLPFGSWDVPAAKEFLSVVHLANASTLTVLILVHIGAVLHHLLVARDGVFQRMWFGARG